MTLQIYFLQGDKMYYVVLETITLDQSLYSAVQGSKTYKIVQSWIFSQDCTIVNVIQWNFEKQKYVFGFVKAANTLR